MPEKIVRLATYSNPVDAEMVKNYLQDAGITVFTAGAEAAAAFVGLDSAFANIELHVPQSQLQQAVHALESFDEDEFTAERNPSEGDDDTAIMEAEADNLSNPVQPTSQFRSGSPAGEFDADFDREEAIVPSPYAGSDDPAADASIQWTPDALANRAWRASFIGMIALPPLLNIYSIWLLIRLAKMDEELSSAALRKVYGAIAIDTFVLIAGALIFLAIFV